MSSYESRKRAWTKYNKSAKKKLVQKRYYDSHREKCKKLSTEWQRKNSNRVNELRRIRYSTPEGKEIRDKSQQKYAINNRIKRLAKDSVHNAIKAGKLDRQPCFMCRNEKSEGHHFDYDKPLKVIWLCKKCHVKIHYGV